MTLKLNASFYFQDPYAFPDSTGEANLNLNKLTNQKSTSCSTALSKPTKQLVNKSINRQSNLSAAQTVASGLLAACRIPENGKE